MWNRKELKARGKAAFKANYWPSVVAGLVVAFIGGLGATSSARATNSPDVQNAVGSMSEEELLAVLAIILGAVALVILVSFVLNVFLLWPLEVGARRFFLVNAEEPARLNELGFSFQHNYLNVVKTCFLKQLFLALWTMLLVIPGIVKAYSYRMVPYILAENPDMSSTEAITLSRNLMNGHKWAAFVLDLSFLGWYILSACTFGLVAVFYVNPYTAATDAELYRTLRYNL